MTTISIAYEVSEEKFKAIQEMIAEQEVRNPNLNGADYVIERSEFTSIDSDEIDDVVLFNNVQQIIRGY